MTWREMVKIQPALRALLKEAKGHKDLAEKDENFCACAVWYGDCQTPGLKGRLMELVGWGIRGDQRLATSQCYDIAYNKIYNALPDCRHPGMC